MALNVAFSVVFDEATDTDSEDNVELRPSEDEACKAFRKWGGQNGSARGYARTITHATTAPGPKKAEEERAADARQRALERGRKKFQSMYADRIVGVAQAYPRRGSNSSQPPVTKLDGAQT